MPARKPSREKPSSTQPSNKKSSGGQDLITRISDTITNHSRLSAAAAFQMGVLLGQAMHQTGAIKGLTRTIASAPGAIASSLPSFGLFDGKPARTSSTRRTARAARKTAATRTSRPAKARAAKRRKRAAR